MPGLTSLKTKNVKLTARRESQQLYAALDQFH